MTFAHPRPYNLCKLHNIRVPKAINPSELPILASPNICRIRVPEAINPRTLHGACVPEATNACNSRNIRVPEAINH
eukprot:6967755-Pyramimonas_sp.AAC.1